VLFIAMNAMDQNQPGLLAIGRGTGYVGRNGVAVIPGKTHLIGLNVRRMIKHAGR